MTKLAIVSGGLSGIETVKNKGLNEFEYESVIAINAGIDTCSVYGQHYPQIFAARDAIHLRMWSFGAREVWTRPKYFDLAKSTLGATTCIDISPESIGYSFTATATLFTAYDHFKWVSELNLFGFDMLNNAAVCRHSIESEQRWQQERKEFDACIKQWKQSDTKIIHHKLEGAVEL